MTVSMDGDCSGSDGGEEEVGRSYCTLSVLYSHMLHVAALTEEEVHSQD